MKQTLKKHFEAYMAAVFACALVAAPLALPLPAQAANSEQTQAMYRLYNRVSHEHLYTADANECEVLSHGDWTYEGVGWVAPKTSNTPVYRLYNPILGDHHYTTDANEVKVLTAKYNWRNEGVGWYSSDSKEVAVYRQFNPGLRVGSHHYTTDANEYKVLTTQRGWNAEGIAWYAVETGYTQNFPTLKSLGVNYDSLVDAVVDSELRKLAQIGKENGWDLLKLSEYDKASVLLAYIGSMYAPGNSSYDAVNLVRQGNGTCFAYSDLMLCMARKLGINAQLSAVGRHVNHSLKSYGSMHRSVIAVIDGAYYDLDANLAYYGYIHPEKIHSSYANYLLGKANSYTKIAP